MLVVNEAIHPMKIQQDRCLAKLMAHRIISIAICYTTLKTMITFKEHMKRAALSHLLAPGPAGVECGFVREFMLFLNGISVGDKSQEGERIHPCNVCDRKKGEEGPAPGRGQTFSTILIKISCFGL